MIIGCAVLPLLRLCGVPEYRSVGTQARGSLTSTEEVVRPRLRKKVSFSFEVRPRLLGRLLGADFLLFSIGEVSVRHRLTASNKST